MNRATPIAACLATLLTAISPAAVSAQLRLGAGQAQATTDPLQQRIELLTEEIAMIRRDTETREPEPAVMVARQARVAMRRIAVVLMKEDGGIPRRGDLGRWGADFTDNRQSVDALLETYRNMANSPQTSDWPQVIAAGRALRGVSDVLAQYNPDSDDAAAPDLLEEARYAACQLMPLIRMLEAHEQGQRPVCPWMPTFGPAATDSRAIESLRAASEALAVGHPARGPLIEAAGVLGDALAFPEYAPRADTPTRLLTRAALLADTTAKADWLTVAQRAAHADALGAAVRDYLDPDQREAATELLLEALSIYPMAVDLQSLHDAGALSPGDQPLLAMVDRLLGVALDGQEVDPSKHAWARRAVEALAHTIGLTREGLRPDALRAFVAVDRRLTQARGSVMETARGVASGSARLTTPAATAALISLESAAEDLARIVRMPELRRRALSLKPQPTYGIPRRLDTLLVAMASANPNNAAVILERFEQQLDLATPLPGEAALVDQLDPETDQSQLHAGADLLRAANQRRRDWASAWASGRDSQDAAGIIEPLHQAMSLRARALAWDTRAADRLNRWAAWHARPQAVDPAIERAQRGIDAVIDLLIAGDADELQLALDSLRDKHGPALAILALHDDLLAREESLPQDTLGLLSRLAFARPDSAWLAEAQPVLDRLARSMEADAPDHAAAEALLDTLDAQRAR